MKKENWLTLFLYCVLALLLGTLPFIVIAIATRQTVEAQNVPSDKGKVIWSEPEYAKTLIGRAIFVPDVATVGEGFAWYFDEAMPVTVTRIEARSDTSKSEHFVKIEAKNKADQKLSGIAEMVYLRIDKTQYLVAVTSVSLTITPKFVEQKKDLPTKTPVQKEKK